MCNLERDCFEVIRYVHSYQSYLWNNAASHRTKAHGKNPVHRIYSDGIVEINLL